MSPTCQWKAISNHPDQCHAYTAKSCCVCCHEPAPMSWDRPGPRDTVKLVAPAHPRCFCRPFRRINPIAGPASMWQPPGDGMYSMGNISLSTTQPDSLLHDVSAGVISSARLWVGTLQLKSPTRASWVPIFNTRPIMFPPMPIPPHGYNRHSASYARTRISRSRFSYIFSIIRQAIGGMYLQCDAPPTCG